MIGIYDNNKIIMHTEKLIGNVFGCIGFVKDENYYIPNTVLREDIRNITNSTNKIVGILCKNIKDKNYKIIKYLCKDTSIEILTSHLKCCIGCNNISFAELFCDFT